MPYVCVCARHRLCSTHTAHYSMYCTGRLICVAHMCVFVCLRAHGEEVSVAIQYTVCCVRLAMRHDGVVCGWVHRADGFNFNRNALRPVLLGLSRCGRVEDFLIATVKLRRFRYTHSTSLSWSSRRSARALRCHCLFGRDWRGTHTEQTCARLPKSGAGLRARGLSASADYGINK